MTAALLAGLFVAPGVLLWMGHRMRDRPARWRGAFWGGVIGHTLGMLVMLAAAHFPPVMWQGGWRAAAVYGAMLAGAVLGAAAGGMRAVRRQGIGNRE